MQFSKNLHYKYPDIVVVGGANWDYSIRASAFPRPGETVRGVSFNEGAGGKGTNQAIAASRLGAKVVLIAKIGNDLRGKLIIETLLKEKIDITHLLKDDQYHTGVALISVADKGRKQVTVASGANERLMPNEIRNIHKIIERAKMLLVQLEVPLISVQYAVEIAHYSQVLVILDPSPTPASPLPKKLLELVDIIKPNAIEAEVLTGIPVKDRFSAFKAAKKLLSMGVKSALVQAGELGDLLLTHQGEELWLPRFQVESIDASGSGDAFLGTLAASISNEERLERAAQLGSAAAALTSRVVGTLAGLPHREELFDFLRSKVKGFTGSMQEKRSNLKMGKTN